MTLDNIKPGCECVVKKVNAQGKLDQRLMDMGLYPGLMIKVIRNAPLKDPMELELDGFYLSLRHEEASYVEVCRR
ncbi:MAG: ferrous iron transport protein A [Deltaproteobacteria bacterium]|nr:ferrous iron transport protein A [Deltaproteobacteria bacterium]